MSYTPRLNTSINVSLLTQEQKAELSDFFDWIETLQADIGKNGSHVVIDQEQQPRPELVELIDLLFWLCDEYGFKLPYGDVSQIREQLRAPQH